MKGVFDVNLLQKGGKGALENRVAPRRRWPRGVLEPSQVWLTLVAEWVAPVPRRVPLLRVGNATWGRA
jgi:hypothetical protein